MSRLRPQVPPISDEYAWDQFRDASGKPLLSTRSEPGRFTPPADPNVEMVLADAREAVAA